MRNRLRGQRVHLVERYVLALEDDLAALDPAIPGPIPREFQVVSVRVAQVDGDVRSVIGQLPQRDIGVDQTAHDLVELVLRGEVQRHVVEAGVPALLRLAVARQPRVEAEVMVVPAGRDEQHVALRVPAGDVARLEDDVEAHDPDVELANAVDVGGAQMHVADANVLVDRPLGTLRRLDRPLRTAHAATSIRRAFSNGSRTRKPFSYASIVIPAASMRWRTSLTSAGVSNWTVQWRNPTVCSGAGGTPSPRQTLKPRWWW